MQPGAVSRFLPFTAVREVTPIAAVFGRVASI